MGSIVGRVSNVIALSSYEYNGEVVELRPNDGLHHRDGGRRNFSKQLWDHKHHGTKVGYRSCTDNLLS